MNLKDKKTIRVTVVGDSTTEGAHFRLDIIKDGWHMMQLFYNRYTDQLIRSLNEWDLERDYELFNEGISGAAVVGNDDLGIPFEGQNKAFSWFKSGAKPNKIHDTDVLMVMLGGNDAPYNWEERKPLFKEKFREIVAAYRAINPNLKLYVMSNYCIRKPSHYEIMKTDIVPLQKELCEELGGTLIDLWPYTEDFIDKIGYEEYIDEGDQEGLWVHPSEIGHTIIARGCFLNLRKTLFEDYEV